jgi:hypothetical protein
LNGLADKVRAQIEPARSLYNRLILVAGPAGTGKTAALRAVCEREGFPYLNLNLVLSQHLLEHPSKARPLRLRGALEEILAKEEGQVVVFDNIEILFDPGLKQDPLRLLQLASRNRTIVASWNGDATGRGLNYAVAGHPEYRRYTEVDAILVSAGRDACPSEGDAR